MARSVPTETAPTPVGFAEIASIVWMNSDFSDILARVLFCFWRLALKRNVPTVISGSDWLTFDSSHLIAWLTFDSMTQDRFTADDSINKVRHFVTHIQA